MRAWGITLRVKGLSIERVLQRAAQEGIALKDIRRTGAREVLVCVGMQDEKEFVRLLEAEGYGVKRVREADAQRAMRLLRRRAMFSAGAALFSILLFLAGECVWKVEVTGAGAAAGEVRRVLEEAQIRPGRPKKLIETQRVQEEIERRLPQIKYVDVRVRGMTLSVFCAQARTPVPASYGGEHGDIVAEKAGIITQLIVRSGTPRVKVGDAVRAGQLLVSGEERISREETEGVAANAQITAQTFYSGTASVRAWELYTQPTGREEERTIIRTPWGDWARNERAQFEMMDVEQKRIPIGGGLWPVTLVYERAIEVEGEKKERERTELEAESAKIAEQIARKNVPIGAQVVDKWVDYSMIEEGICAQVVLTCEEDIALVLSSAP